MKLRTSHVINVALGPTLHETAGQAQKQWRHTDGVKPESHLGLKAVTEVNTEIGIHGNVVIVTGRLAVRIVKEDGLERDMIERDRVQIHHLCITREVRAETENIKYRL